MYEWAKNIGYFIEASQTSFAILLFGLSVVAPILIYTLVSLEIASLLAWIAFLVIVLLAPKVEYLVTSSMIYE